MTMTEVVLIAELESDQMMLGYQLEHGLIPASEFLKTFDMLEERIIFIREGGLHVSSSLPTCDC